MEERLQKILARSGFASRRGAEQLMLEGRVSVNGRIAHELGTKADLERDDVRVDGVRVKPPKGPVYLVLNKPRGIVTTRRDPEGRQTVMDLVPQLPGLFPVGRLDVTTEGLILLTNDGVFAERVSHPRYEVPRVYHAKVHGVPDERTLARLRRGVQVESELLAVDRVRILKSGTSRDAWARTQRGDTAPGHGPHGNAWVELTLHEGKHHEVRRMLEAVGHKVAKLRRVAFGPLTTRGLEPGEFRELTPDEIARLLRGEGRREPRPLHKRRPTARAHGRGGRRPAERPRRDGPRPGGAAGPPRADRSERSRVGDRGNRVSGRRKRER